MQILVFPGSSELSVIKWTCPIRTSLIVFGFVSFVFESLVGI